MSAASRSSLSLQIQQDAQIGWLNYVQTNAKYGAAENIRNLCDLATRVPFKEPMSEQIQSVVTSVSNIATTKIYDPDLCEKASLALKSLQIQK